MNGYTATGKTTVANRLSKLLKSPVLHTFDVRREIYNSFDLYDWEHKDLVYQTICKKAEKLLETSNIVILDGSFHLHKWRHWVYNLSQNLKAFILICQCICKDHLIVTKRIHQRKQNNHPMSEANDIALYKLIVKKNEPINDDNFDDSLSPMIIQYDSQNNCYRIINNGNLQASYYRKLKIAFDKLIAFMKNE